MRVIDVSPQRLAEIVLFETTILGTPPPAICRLFDDAPNKRALGTYLREHGFPIVASIMDGRAA